MPSKVLNQVLLTKIADNTQKSAKYVREQSSKRASREGVSSLAAQIKWAQSLGIGVAHALRQGGSEIRQEVRGTGLNHSEQRHVGARNDTKKKPRSQKSKRRGNTVFVVHGRNENLRKAIFSFLRAIGLNPLEWNTIIRKTRKANPYVGDILSAAFREANAVVVLLTPDDEARLKKRYLNNSDQQYESKLAGQARPNVLFEAGMAFGSHPDNTVLVQVGDLRPFSDIAGRHLVRLDNTVPKRQELATKLENAGCQLSLSGIDWHSEGDFSA